MAVSRDGLRVSDTPPFMESLTRAAEFHPARSAKRLMFEQHVLATSLRLLQRHVFTANHFLIILEIINATAIKPPLGA